MPTDDGARRPDSSTSGLDRRAIPAPKRRTPIDIESFDIYHLRMTAPSEEPIGLLVTRTAKGLGRSFDAALAERGGSLASWLVLSSLMGGLHRTQRSIAADVGIEGPTLTHHLNRMEVDGLVTRQRDPENRRAHQVELTEHGHAEFRALLGAVQTFDERLRAGFTDEELTTLRQLLRRLASNAAAAVEPDGKERP
jgi:MarR family transcriptional regulator, transcriptional regulator for hemolysin